MDQPLLLFHSAYSHMLQVLLTLIIFWLGLVTRTRMKAMPRVCLQHDSVMELSRHCV